MFGLFKAKTREIPDPDVINMFGFFLQSREKIISAEVFLKEERYMTGIIGMSRKALNDELDAVVLFYARKIYESLGIDEARQITLLDKLFDEFIQNEAFSAKDGAKIRAQLDNRYYEYKNLKNHESIATAFLVHVIGMTNFDLDLGSYSKPVLVTLEKNINKIITTEHWA